MKKLAIVLLIGLFGMSVNAADEIVVPVAKVDLLKVNDAAKANLAGKSIPAKAIGYVKDGVIYIYESIATATKKTTSVIAEHPYISVATVLGAIFVDRNNNFTKLWGKDGSDSSKGSTTTSSIVNDHPVTVTAGNYSPVTITYYSNNE